MVLFLSFNYTQLNQHQISKVFQVGRLFRLEYDVVPWDKVLTAKVCKPPRSSAVNLLVTTKNGKTITFTVLQHGGGDTFDAIANFFQNGGALTHA
jgi:hypothetical protein